MAIGGAFREKRPPLAISGGAFKEKAPPLGVSGGAAEAIDGQSPILIKERPSFSERKA